jgi:hypothetical protein
MPKFNQQHSHFKLNEQIPTRLLTTRSLKKKKEGFMLSSLTFIYKKGVCYVFQKDNRY